MTKTEIIKPSQKVLNRAFPTEEGIDKTLLQVTNEGLYSMSGVKVSCFIADIIIKHMKTKDLIITDGTGNNGSETIIYALLFKKINSIEMNPINFEVLKNNVNVYKLKNVNLINGDTTKELEGLTQDVVVIDAPWGGPIYKQNNSVKLYMSSMEISDIVNKFSNKTKLFILKVPRNYDINYFGTKVIKDFKVYNYVSEKENKAKFKIIVIENF